MAISEYYATYMITNDSDFRLRITACARTESEAAGAPIANPDEWAFNTRWDWATTPGWAAKVQSALDLPVENWGRDPSVITDGDILSCIQPMVQPSPPPEGP
jgi:hypothetical protein